MPNPVRSTENFEKTLFKAADKLIRAKLESSGYGK